MKLTPSTAGTGRLARRLGVLVAVGCMLMLSACGFGVQTLRPYTPGEGVNTDIGLGPNGAPTENTVKVRGLLIIAHPDGSAFLSGSFTCPAGDELVEVAGTALQQHGQPAGPLTIELSEPVSVAGGDLVNLTDRAPITVEGDLTPGFNAQLTLTFAEAGSQQIEVPVVDGAFPPYSSVSPSAPSESTAATEE